MSRDTMADYYDDWDSDLDFCCECDLPLEDDEKFIKNGEVYCVECAPRGARRVDLYEL